MMSASGGDDRLVPEDVYDVFVEAELILPRTRLAVEKEQLIRYTPEYTITSRIPLRSIEKLEFRSEINYASSVMIAIALSMAGIGRFVSEIHWVTLVCYFVALGLGALAILGILSDQIRFVANGIPISIACNESKDEGQGFVASLQGLIAKAKAANPAP